MTPDRANLTDRDARRMERRVRTLLNHKVREALNLLFTEAMQPSPGGWDFGLFCREHAYLTYLLARKHGIPAELVLGQYFVRAPSGYANKAVDTPNAHAWC